jgi:hypothetical protein
MHTKGAHSQGSLLGNVLTGHTRFHNTHINHLYKIPSIVGGILQSHESEHTFILSTCFLFLFLDTYYILFCAMSLSFLFIQFFNALSDCLVCLVVKLAVCVTVLKSFTALSAFGLCSPLECTGEYSATTRRAAVMRMRCGSNLNCSIQLWAVFSHLTPCISS